MNDPAEEMKRAPIAGLRGVATPHLASSLAPVTPSLPLSTSPLPSSFSSSSLLHSIEEKSLHARRSGALQTIPTRCQLIKDTNAPSDERGKPLLFPVRIKTEGGVYNKPDVLSDNLRKRDPFVPPYEEDLFVEWDFSVGPAHSPRSKHVLVLNKYNVLPNHALIVTTDFQPQTDPLNERDFEVFWRSVDNVRGFGFYNCGANAGPSQPHKHMQVVPLPLEDGTELPLLRVLDEQTSRHADHGAPFTLPQFPFNHAVCRLPKHLCEADSQMIGRDLAEMYRRLLAAIHKSTGENEQELQTNGHHNVLLSPRWMLVVPRTREGMDGLSGNGLVFAGVFFTKDQQLCNKLADIGPINFLTRITS